MELTRRQFVRSLGGGGLAIAILGISGCSQDRATPATGGWSRVDLGFVSAYVYVRAGEAALVDTGTGGSAADIADVLEGIGLGWGDLSTVILTHVHGDHVGSLPEIMELAPSATAHAGPEDIPAMTSPRPVTPVADGEMLFGLTIITTPGHTAGHISVLDPDGALVAGDALTGADGGVDGPNPDFTADMGAATASVVKLSGLDYERIYFGHGEPVTEGGSSAVSALVADG